jgi:hypothetical protein
MAVPRAPKFLAAHGSFAICHLPFAISGYASRFTFITLLAKETSIPTVAP